MSVTEERSTASRRRPSPFAETASGCSPYSAGVPPWALGIGTGLKWAQIDLKQGQFTVVRAKNGTPLTHPPAWTRNPRSEAPKTPVWGFPLRIRYGARKGPLTASGVRKILARAGEKAGLEFSVHPHMLRHGCGFKLANDGHDTRAIQHYLGHKQIQHTVRYTELASGRFDGFWKD